MDRAILQPFLDQPGLAHLGPEARSGAQSFPALRKELDQLFAANHLTGQAAELIRGCIYLWHDHLDAAHEIAQRIHNSDGSLLHAIMHRREGDFTNSKYWLRQTGAHPLYEALGAQAEPMLDPTLAREFLAGNRWNPNAFVDACEQAEATHGVLRQLQKLEMELFLDHLLDAAANE